MKNGQGMLVYGRVILIVVISVYYFLLPGVSILQALTDPGLRSGEMPRFAYRWHQALSRDMEEWALQRVASGVALEMDISNISGTEWSVFSSVFYLWATEALQAAWEQEPSLAERAPADYARGAIEAAAAWWLTPTTPPGCSSTGGRITSRARTCFTACC